MLKNTGSWMYCDKCNKTVAYLCYTTYQSFQFNFYCNCGNKGSFKLSYKSDIPAIESKKELISVKNRLCCPTDNSPLFTIVDKNIKNATYTLVCKKCGSKYSNID